MKVDLERPLLDPGCREGGGEAGGDVVRTWAQTLRGLAPVLPQLPTDPLGPADQHRWAEESTSRSVAVSAGVVARVAEIAGSPEAAIVAAFAALLGRYSRCNQVPLGLWRSSSRAFSCQPLLVDLLRPVGSHASEDEEESAIAPASCFADVRLFASRVHSGLLAGAGSQLDAAGLVALDQAVATSADLAQPQVLRAFDAGVVLGRGFLAKGTKRPPVLLVCPQWPPPRSGTVPLQMTSMQGVFQPETAVQVLRHMAVILEDMSQHADVPVCQLRLLREPSVALPLGLNAGELEEVTSWGDKYSCSCYCPAAVGQEHWSADRSVISMVDEVAQKLPNAVAIVDDGAGKAYTYADFLDAVGRVGSVLRRLGVGPDVMVPILAPRGATMLFGIFGILRAGGAYVPLDLHWPDERLADVLVQCSAKLVLGAQSHCRQLAALGAGAQVVCIEDAVKETASFEGNTSGTSSGKDVVYVFFTSGSTGKPKGVMVENRGLAHRTHLLLQNWPLRPGDGVMLKAAYTFGLSEWEIFSPLCAGAALVLAAPGGEKDADYLLQRTCGVFTSSKAAPGSLPEVKLVWHVFVPSALQMMLERFDELEDEELGRKADVPSSAWWRDAPMRHIITCGEPLSDTLVHRFYARYPRCSIINMYGPTEGEMTQWEVPRGSRLQRVSAGVPCCGSQIFLADLRSRCLAASLEPAEVTFGGPFIARGYLGRPDLTERAFVPDFTGRSERLYMTGDLARWRQGGQLELLGRRDFQVKIRGFRIELGEIEAAMHAAGARAAICVVRKGAGGAASLVAYYEPGNAGPVSEAAVRTSCQRMLPPYMQPQAIVQMERLPRNINGKVDRAKLPDPPEQTPANGASAAGVLAKPSTPSELAVAAAWAEVLGLDPEKVPAEVDFQELGGTSLLAGRATAMIRKRVSVTDLPGTAIYKHSTVRRLAVLVDALLEEQNSRKADEQTQANGTMLVPALQPCGPGLSSTRPFGLFVQGMGAFLLNFMRENQAWSPFWWAAWFLYADYGRNALFCFLPFAILLDNLLQVCLLVTVKWVIVGKLKPGVYPLWGWDYYKWWFVSQQLNHVLQNVMPIVADTPAANIILRMLGAEVGAGARIGITEISEPDLIKIGKGATVGKKTRLSASAVLHGSLYLNEVRIGEGAAVGPHAVLSQGTEVPAGRVVLPLSTATGWHGAVGSVATRDATKVGSDSFHRRQDLLRVFVGLPVLLTIFTLSYVPAVFVLEQLWVVLKAWFGEQAFTVFSIVLAWVYVHPIWLGFVAVVILQKRLLVGTFTPGKKKWCHWDELAHWLHARAVESHEFAEVCDMWTNTEVLSVIYRLLGTKIGKRVQIDHFYAVEHDLIEIGDYTVFGSEVLFSNDGRAPWSPPWAAEEDDLKVIRACRGANLLDHCTLLPGVLVAERAVLGTCTLAPYNTYFPPLAVQSGSLRGRSVHLRDQNSPPGLRALEEKAMRDLDNPWVWWGFNATMTFRILLARPLPEAIWILTYFGVVAIWDSKSDSVLSMLLVTPIVYNVIDVIMLLLNLLLKWLIVGRYRAGDHPFFGRYHLRWMTMVLLGRGVSGLSETLHGTPFQAWVYRACGATVGKDCYLAGLALEYDLLTIGDNVAINPGCDTTCHTVENMVIKLSPTRVASGAALLPASFAMPGSVVEERAVLLEHTQVLKGETVPAGEVWAGMPAARCSPTCPSKI